MNRKILIYSITIVLLIVSQLTTFRVYTHDAKADAGKTGAPGEQTCAKSECHNDHVLNSGPGSISIEISGDSSYQSGQDYVLTVTVQQTGVPKHGFEITAVRDDTGGPAGTFASPVIDPRTVNWNVQAVQGRKYVTHNNADSTQGEVGHWTVGWKAATTNQGCVTFYAAGNNADGNNNDTLINGQTGFAGDYIYTTSLQVCPAINFGIYEVGGMGNLTFVYGNPVSDKLNVQYLTDQNDLVSIKLYDMNGKLIDVLFNEEEIPGLHSHSFNVRNVASGIYFILLESGGVSKAEKIIVQ